MKTIGKFKSSPKNRTEPLSLSPIFCENLWDFTVPNLGLVSRIDCLRISSVTSQYYLDLLECDPSGFIFNEVGQSDEVKVVPTRAFIASPTTVHPLSRC